MYQSDDLVILIEILNTGIEINMKEEEFFRRSARVTGKPVAKMLFLEMAQDLAQYRASLENRKHKLLDAFSEAAVVETAAKS